MATSTKRKSLVKVEGGWSEICELAYRRAQEIRQAGLQPTLRSLFYWLADGVQVIVHSQDAYKSLSREFARWREKHGVIDVLVDKSRRVIENDDRTAIDLNEYLVRTLESEIRFLENIAWKLPRWYGYRKKIEVWIEKEAVTVIESLSRELSIDAFPSRGFSSITKLYEAVKRLEGFEPVILVLTDFDPSGMFIDFMYRKKLEEYGLKAEFERLAVLPEQIEKYNLPAIPQDDPSYARIRRDSRYREWVRFCNQHGVPAEPVELDAFVGLHPDKFAELIKSAVSRHIDAELELRREEEEKKRREQAIELAGVLRDFLSKLEEMSRWRAKNLRADER